MSLPSGGLIAACQSPFLRAIRENPILLQREHFACSLFEHSAELEALAQQFGAYPSGKPAYQKDSDRIEFNKDVTHCTEHLS